MSFPPQVRGRNSEKWHVFEKANSHKPSLNPGMSYMRSFPLESYIVTLTYVQYDLFAVTARSTPYNAQSTAEAGTLPQVCNESW